MSAELFLPVTGRVQVMLDEPDDGAAAVLVGFHGYGEPPERTLRALQGVDVPRLARWTPRGPHHFYDRRGRVVASWMSRFDREAQIDQQVALLRAMFDAIAERHPRCPVFALGFSQGGATAWRAAVLTGRPLAHLFILAGDMPPEVAERIDSSPPVGVSLMLGREDSVVGKDVLERDRDRARLAGWTADLHELEGGHDYLPGALELVASGIRGHTLGETKQAP